MTTSTDMPGEGRPDPVGSLTLEADGDFTMSSWQQFCDLVRPHLLRLKGFISLEGQAYYLDATTHTWSLQPVSRPGGPAVHLVLIGQGFPQQEIETAFHSTSGEEAEVKKKSLTGCPFYTLTGKTYFPCQLVRIHVTMVLTKGAKHEHVNIYRCRRKYSLYPDL